MVSTIGEPLDICVPSGNFGNILAAYIAKQMGLPLKELIVATNENNVLDTFFSSGLYKQKDVHVTSSPSMDISKASNIERFFFDILGRDPQACSRTMNAFEHDKQIDLSQHLSSIQDTHEFRSGMASHADRIHCIQRVYERCNLIIDPHTAAGVHVAEALSDKSRAILCMETAKPTKFEAAIQESLGFVPDRPAGFEKIEEKEQRFFDVDATVDDIKSFIKEHVAK